jgi:hypothetical protein
MTTLTRAHLLQDTDRLRPKGPLYWFLEIGSRRINLGPVSDNTREEAIRTARAMGYDPSYTDEPAVLQELA